MDPPFAVPVDDPAPDVPVVPDVLPDDVLPVPVPEAPEVPGAPEAPEAPDDGEPAEPVEPIVPVVPGLEDVDDSAVPVEPGAVEVAVSVEVVDVPSPVPAAMLSPGALGLTPPPLITVEMPPLARSLTLVTTVVVEPEDAELPDAPVPDAELPAPAPAPAAGGRAAIVAGNDTIELLSLSWITRLETPLRGALTRA